MSHYFSDPTTLALLSFLLVAAVRKRWPVLDGMLLVLACSVVAGIVLAAAGAAAGLLAGATVESWPHALATGAASGVLAFGAANGWQWAVSKLPVTLQGAAAELLEDAIAKVAPKEPKL